MSIPERLHQRTVERDGVRTEVWLERCSQWSRRQYVIETGEHRTPQPNEPTDADIERHRREAV